MVIVKVDQRYGRLAFDSARPDRQPEHRAFDYKELVKLSGNKEAVSGIAELTRRLLVELAQQGYTLPTTRADGELLSTCIFT